MCEKYFSRWKDEPKVEEKVVHEEAHVDFIFETILGRELRDVDIPIEGLL